jgi:hypothetical protein
MRFVWSVVSVTDTTDSEPGSRVSVTDRTDTRLDLFRTSVVM